MKTTMKTMRKNRYATQIRAVKKALKGKNQTEEHRQKIGESVTQWRTNEKKRIRAYKDVTNIEFDDQNKASNIANVEIIEKFFDSMSEAAREIGCSKQLISQCVKRPDVFHSARGWKIELVAV